VVSSTPANGDAEPGPGEVWLELDVYGMRCQGCATNLRLGLGEVDGVRQVDVDVPGERVAVVGQAELLDEAALRTKVEELGYRLTPKAPLFQGRWRARRGAR
jgi:copper chaperone CopZ